MKADNERKDISAEAARKRDSGNPGGGAGRIEEVGHTGVYPASGPLPEGPAEIVTPAAWGQGVRGAAGYEDSGSSEVMTMPPDTGSAPTSAAAGPTTHSGSEQSPKAETW